MKKSFRTTGALYICLLLMSCDFQDIEKFEMPTWNWPLSFPLLEEKYTFAEMGVTYDSTLGYYVNANGDSAVNNNIYFDQIDSSLYIEFSANLMGEDSTSVGVDESFSQYFEIASMNLGVIESIEIEAIDFPPVDTTILTSIPITIFPDDGNVFGDPLNFFSDLFIPDESLLIESNFQQEVFTIDDLVLFESIDSLAINDGVISVSITNNFPFDISNLELTFSTDNGQLWSANFNDIGFGITVEDALIMSDDNMKGFTQNMLIEYSIRIDPQDGDITCTEYNEGEELTSGELATCSGLNTGWGLSSVLEDNQLIMNIGFEINSAYSITGRTLPQEMSEIIKIGLPPNELIQVVGGKITSEYSSGITNSLVLDLENNLFAPINFSMQFPNFYDTSGNILEIDTFLDLESQFIDDLSFAGKHMGNADNPGNEIDSIAVFTEITIEAYDATILLDNPGRFDINEITVSPIKLEYVTAATENLVFETPSIEIADIPSGFAGFEFADLTLEFNIYNQIGIPVTLDLELKGYKETGDTVTIVIDPKLSYNNVDENGDLFMDSDASLQDSAYTRVILDKNGQTSEEYSFDKVNSTWELDTTIFTPKESTILDVMTIAPDGMIVSGGANINGKGILAPNTFVWGDFTMIAPLSFLFTDDITFVPADPTVLDTMDESTRTKIDSALIVAQMTLDVTNSIPFGGDLSLLVSDYSKGLCSDTLSETCRDNYFPVYIDKLENVEITNQSIMNDSTYGTIFNADTSFLISEIGINRIEIEELSADDPRAFIVNFIDYSDNTIFWIGRLFSLNIEPPDTVESQSGYVQVPSNYLDVIELDTTRIGWITADKTLNMMPIITFENTNDFYCTDSTADASICTEDEEGCGIGICMREPRAFQTTNYIEISSFITFTLNTGALFETTPTVPMDQNTPNSGNIR